MGGLEINKDEILAKSRKEQHDEGFVDAENRGQKIGISAFCLVFGFIVLFNFFNGESSYAPMAMFFAFIAAKSYPGYSFTNNKWYLVTVVVSVIACIASLSSFIITTLR